MQTHMLVKGSSIFFFFFLVPDLFSNSLQVKMYGVALPRASVRHQHMELERKHFFALTTHGREAISIAIDTAVK